jgi:hypothetical protein
MKPFVPLLVGLGLVLCGCDKKPEAAKPAVGDNPLTAPADYVGAALKAQQHAVKTLGKVSLDQAIKAFSGQEGRNPTNLQELVSSGVLPQLPEPPTGMKFSYNPATGEAKVVPAK